VAQLRAADAGGLRGKVVVVQFCTFSCINLSAHLIFGIATAAAFELLIRKEVHG
jgi:hypothetical protein